MIRAVTFSKVMKAFYALFACQCLLFPFGSKAHVYYLMMHEIFDKSDKLIIGTVSSSKVIYSPNKPFVCGSLMTLESPKILMKNGTIKYAESIEVSYLDLEARGSGAKVGERVIIFDQAFMKPEIALKSQITGTSISPYYPFLTYADPATGEEVKLDCSGLYPDSVDVHGKIRFNVTKYQLVGETQSAGDQFSSPEVMEIDLRRLGSFRDPILTRGVKGWRTWDGEVVLCQTEEACTKEVIHAQLNMNHDDYRNQRAYLLDVNAVIEAYLAHEEATK